MPKPEQPSRPATPGTIEERTAAAIDAANKAFWTRVVALFPEVTAGNYPPNVPPALESAADDAVRAWVQQNVPGADVPEDAPEPEPAVPVDAADSD